VSVRPFYKADGCAILNVDGFSTRAVTQESIGLIVTSPLYNLDIAYGSHDDGQSYERYLDFSRRWLARCHARLKRDGRMCLNIPLEKNKDEQQSLGADLTTITKEIGFKYHSTIV
jgi:site-specific DNA-methyltransferase (adenine-specific)